MRHILLATAALAAVCGAAFAGEAENNRIIFGKDITGDGKAYACFHRAYDTAHLAQHPKQNLRDMLLLLWTDVDPENGRGYSAKLGVTFRTSASQFQSGSGCVVSGDSKNALNCPIDCDGGEIDVQLRDANSLLVSIPDGAQTWDPNATEETDPALDPQFGTDDKLFRLDRTDISDCVPIAADDDQKADLTATQ